IGEALGEQVHGAVAVRPDRASAVPEVVRAAPVGGGGCDRLLRPRRAAVGGTVDVQRGGGVAVLVGAVAPELISTDVHAAEEPARGRVVGPDLLLVLEARLTLVARHDDRGLPAALEEHRGGRRVVEAG